MVTKNAESVKQSHEVSGRSREASSKGKSVVQEMIHSIGEIHQSNDETMAHIESMNHEIANIAKMIADIGNKTKVINDIVFQTKLLSFNASVEAARAGEHGKGFAVVAEEVGNLAQMSGNAAKEISQMLEGSIHKVEEIVKNTKLKIERLIKSGNEKVTLGSATASRCGEVLDEILANVSQVDQLLNEISKASQEQSIGIHEITRTMNQLNQVSQKNTTASQDSSNESGHLVTQTEELKKRIADLLAEGVAIHPTMGLIPENGQSNLRALNSKKKKNTKAAVPEQELRSLVGQVIPFQKVPGVRDLPSEDDPRFEDF